MIIKKGEVYDVSDRHGNMTIKFLEDVDYSEDIFFEATILVGNKQYASRDYQLSQQINGDGTQGTKSTFRTILCHLGKRRTELE